MLPPDDYNVPSQAENHFMLFASSLKVKCATEVSFQTNLRKNICQGNLILHLKRVILKRTVMAIPGRQKILRRGNSILHDKESILIFWVHVGYSPGNVDHSSTVLKD